MNPDSTAKGGTFGFARRVARHRRTTSRLMISGVVISLIALIVLLASVGSEVAVTAFVVLLLLSCLVSCLVVWRVSEHDAAALEHEVEALRANRPP